MNISVSSQRLRELKEKIGERCTENGLSFSIVIPVISDEPEMEITDAQLYGLDRIGCCIYYLVTGKEVEEVENDTRVMVTELRQSDILWLNAQYAGRKDLRFFESKDLCHEMYFN